MMDCITFLTYIQIRSFLKITDGFQISNWQKSSIKYICIWAYPVAENMTDYSDLLSIERRINENLLYWGLASSSDSLVSTSDFINSSFIALGVFPVTSSFCSCCLFLRLNVSFFLCLFLSMSLSFYAFFFLCLSLSRSLSISLSLSFY